MVLKECLVLMGHLAHLVLMVHLDMLVLLVSQVIQDQLVWQEAILDSTLLSKFCAVNDLVQTKKYCCLSYNLDLGWNSLMHTHTHTLI